MLVHSICCIQVYSKCYGTQSCICVSAWSNKVAWLMPNSKTLNSFWNLLNQNLWIRCGLIFLRNWNIHSIQSIIQSERSGAKIAIRIRKSLLNYHIFVLYVWLISNFNRIIFYFCKQKARLKWRILICINFKTTYQSD